MELVLHVGVSAVVTSVLPTVVGWWRREVSKGRYWF